MKSGRPHMQQLPDLAVDAMKATPPSTVAVLTVFGVSVSDAVQSVMLIWALMLVIEKACRNVWWIRRRILRNRRRGGASE